MSLVDDQIVNNSSNALDEYSRRMNKIRTSDIARAIMITQKFEADMAGEKEPDEYTYVDQESLLKGIKEDMFE